MAHAGPAQTVPTAPHGDLALLVATEQELESRLIRAREQARSLVEAATSEVQAQAIEHEREAAEAHARFQAEVERERSSRAADMLAEGRRLAARFDDLPESRIAALAGVVLERLLSGRER